MTSNPTLTASPTRPASLNALPSPGLLTARLSSLVSLTTSSESGLSLLREGVGSCACRSSHWIIGVFICRLQCSFWNVVHYV